MATDEDALYHAGMWLRARRNGRPRVFWNCDTPTIPRPGEIVDLPNGYGRGVVDTRHGRKLTVILNDPSVLDDREHNPGWR